MAQSTGAPIKSQTTTRYALIDSRLFGALQLQRCLEKGVRAMTPKKLEKSWSDVGGIENHALHAMGRPTALTPGQAKVTPLALDRLAETIQAQRSPTVKQDADKRVAVLARWARRR